MSKELLAVLNMTEDEQCIWLYEYFKKKYYKNHDWPNWYGVCDVMIHNTFPGRKVILADLAYRLRDEVSGKGTGIYVADGGLEIKAWDWGKVERFTFCTPTANSVIRCINEANEHFADKATPIEVIIAALIAKGMAKDG